MFKTLLYIVVIFLLLACNENNQRDTSNNILLNAKEIKKVDVCDQVSSKDVANIMGWKSDQIKKEQNFSFSEYSFSDCQFTGLNGKSIVIKLYVKSEKAQKNKVLEKQFENFINNGFSKFTYKSVESDFTASIFGEREFMGQYYYHLKNRVDNTLEISAEMSLDENNKQEALKKLQNLTKLISQ